MVTLSSLTVLNFVTVLYSQRYNQWKIAGFGATTEATSKHAKPTELCRSTASYRAPEVITQYDYTNKADIWALGCILFELASNDKAFVDDWSVQQYALDLHIPDLSTNLPTHCQSQIQNYLEQIFRLDWSQRPRASILRREFFSCRVFSDRSHLQQQRRNRIIDLPNRSLSAWHRLVALEPENSWFQEELAGVLNKKGDILAAITCWAELLHMYPHSWRFQERLSDAYDQFTDPKVTVMGWNFFALSYPNNLGMEIKRLVADEISEPGDFDAAWQQLLVINSDPKPISFRKTEI